MKDNLLALMWSMLAISAGSVVIFIGDYLLGVRLELYWGISTFSPLWALNIFLVPLIGGITVSVIYGLGGKMLSYFPALIVHGFNYWSSATGGALPDGASILPILYWGFIAILAIEACAVGGVIGELVVKKTYGRVPKEMVYKQSEPGKEEA